MTNGGRARSATVFFWPLVSFSARNHRAAPPPHSDPTSFFCRPLHSALTSFFIPSLSGAPAEPTLAASLLCPDRISIPPLSNAPTAPMLAAAQTS